VEIQAKPRTHRRTTTQRRIPAPRATPKQAPKFTIPDFSEWQDFIGDFALKWLCRGYIAFIFRGYDRWELLSAVDNEALEPDTEQLRDMAKPLAHLAAKSKFSGKYGRLALDSKDAIVATIQFGMWMNRVNRIARKAANTERARSGVIIPGNVEPGTEAGESVPSQAYTPNTSSFNGNGSPGFGYN
jgi:hypothetical protein